MEAERVIDVIQEIAPRVYHLDYRVKAPDGAGRVFCFREGKVLLTRNRQVPTWAQLCGCPIRCRYLFAIDREEFYLGEPDGPIRAPGLEWMHRKVLRSLEPLSMAFAGYTARHLEHWYRDNRFCGRCGGPMEPGQDERKLLCPACGYQVYPRINPAVIVAVHDGDRLLMARYAKRPIPWFVLLAGFVEVGETAEQCVAREVREEVGIAVKNIRYYGSQPWGMSGNLTLAYTAELDGDSRLRVDRSELAEARWFARNEVPIQHSDRVSITQDMVRAFAQGRF